MPHSSVLPSPLVIAIQQARVLDQKIHTLTSPIYRFIARAKPQPPYALRIIGMGLWSANFPAERVVLMEESAVCIRNKASGGRVCGN
jgi:hypothetical protein